MARSAASIAKNSARAREWAKENRERVNAQRRASRAQARPAMTDAEKLADTQYLNWLEVENNIRAVVSKAIEAGTIQRGSMWFEMTLEEYLATPIRPYLPTRQRAAK